METTAFDPRRRTARGGNTLVATAAWGIGLGLMAVAATFFTTVVATVYGGFPLWLV